MTEPFGNSLPAGKALRLVAVLFVVLALIIAAVLGLARLWRVQADAGEPARANARGAVEHLETAPQQKLAAYLAAKNRLANSYAWIDKRDGIARIPVDVAMRAMAIEASRRVRASAP